MNPKLTVERLERGAIVYIRQSTPGQVLHHQEGRRRQYALEDQARQLGFQRVSVVDEDLGRSGSGLVERAGFQQLVGAVCEDVDRFSRDRHRRYRRSPRGASSESLSPRLGRATEVANALDTSLEASRT